MAEDDATQTLFDTYDETYDALIQRLKVANDRAHRLSNALIGHAHQGQREAADLWKRWAEAPLDLFGFWGFLAETVTKPQLRALEFSREYFAELAEAQQESRAALERSVSANRRSTEATAGAARELLSRASANR